MSGMAGGSRSPERRSARVGGGYFRYGTRVEAFKAVDSHVHLRVRAFLARRHKEPMHGSRRFPPDRVYAELGVLRLYNPKTRVPPVSG